MWYSTKAMLACCRRRRKRLQQSMGALLGLYGGQYYTARFGGLVRLGYHKYVTSVFLVTLWIEQ